MIYAAEDRARYRMLGVRGALCGAAMLVSGCASVPAPGTADASPQIVSQSATQVPAGFGTLRQDDIAIRLALPGGLQVRATPLNESFTRLLSPDINRALGELVASKQVELDQVKQRVRMPSYSIWLLDFFAQEQGETRFSPLEIVIRNVGRDFRPLEVVALSPGFGEYRLRQRDTKSALFVFDGEVDENQPLSIIMETTESSGWQAVLQRVERERALVRSRASAQVRRDTVR